MLPRLYTSSIGTAVVPFSIAKSGAVAGANDYLGSLTGLVFSRGTYRQAFSLGTAPGQVGLARNNSGVIIADAPSGTGKTFYDYGRVLKDSGLARIKLDPTSFLVSINTAGTAAGTYNPGQPSLFTYKGGKVTPIIIPGAVAAYGGFINDSAQIAGTYIDSTGATHGFIQQAGITTIFDAPVPITTMQVTGLSNTGYIAGLYTTADSAQTVFIYHAGTVLTLGPYAAPQTLQVFGVSDTGVTTLNVLVPNTSVTPYTTICTGTGC